MEQGTLQEPDGKALPDGVIGEIGHKKAVLVVTIEAFDDATIKIDSKSSDGSPVTLGRVKKLLEDCNGRYADRILATMVQAEVKRVVAQAANMTKDRNMIARLFHALR